MVLSLHFRWLIQRCEEGARLWIQFGVEEHVLDKGYLGVNIEEYRVDIEDHTSV